MHDISNQYWAGFFDGEGSVSISNVLRPKANLTQNNRKVLDYAQSIFGGSVYKKGLLGHSLMITNIDKVDFFLKSIYPFLIVKKDEVSVVIELIGSLTKKNNGCHPLSAEEKDRRLTLRRKLQEIRPDGLFVDSPPMKTIKREEIKKAQENKCFDCGMDLTGQQFNAIINKDQKLRCRVCSAKLFGPNKNPAKPVTKEQIEEAIKSSSNMDIAAKTLGLCRATLYHKRKQFGLV